MYSVKTLTAENTFTDAIAIIGQFNVSISGTFSGTVTLQRKFSDETDWFDINSWTAAFEGWDEEPSSRSTIPEIVTYRLGFKTGDFSSGSAKCRIGQP